MSDPELAVNTKSVPADFIPLRDKVRSLQLQTPSNSTAVIPADSTKKWLMLGCAVMGFLLLANFFGWFTFSNSSTVAIDTNSATSSTQGGESNADNPAEGLSTASSRTSAESATNATGIVLESNGYFVPARKILVSPKVSGMLLQSNLQEGKYFRKGDVLGVIESVDYQADLQRALASKTLAEERLRELEHGNRREEIDQVKAELAESEAMFKKAESDFKRSSELIQRNSITRAEFDQDSANFSAARRRVERLEAALRLMQIGAREERIAQAKAEVQQSEADLVKARWRLDNCEIRSPVNGTILSKNAEEGNVVNPVALNGSYSLCEMADLSDLEVDLKIQERDISRVFVGQKCRVRAIAYPERNYEAIVDRLMPIADRSKGAVPIRVKVTVPSEEQGVFLKPEMGAIVTFFGEKTLPEATPTSEGKSSHAGTVRSDTTSPLISAHQPESKAKP